jgi:hypothetical protein
MAIQNIDTPASRKPVMVEISADSFAGSPGSAPLEKGKKPLQSRPFPSYRIGWHSFDVPRNRIFFLTYEIAKIRKMYFSVVPAQLGIQ